MKKQSILKVIATFTVVVILLTMFASCGGKDGKDGVTPTIEISEDGYWVINGTKTEIKAAGTDGKDGKDGLTPTIEISEDGYWIINGVKTEYKAIGVDGTNGTNGTNGIDGVTPTIEISADGYWVINGTKTDVKASSEAITEGILQGLHFTYNDSVGTYSVSWCYTSSSNVVIPAIYRGRAVTQISEAAFADCSSLASVTIPDSVTSIGNDAFRYCTSLKSVTIGNSVKSIGDSAFYFCDSLTSITIPDSVTSIGVQAFQRCTSLTSIKFEGTVEQWNSISFGYIWNQLAPATEVVCSDGVVPLS